MLNISSTLGDTNGLAAAESGPSSEAASAHANVVDEYGRVVPRRLQDVIANDLAQLRAAACIVLG